MFATVPTYSPASPVIPRVAAKAVSKTRSDVLTGTPYGIAIPELYGHVFVPGIPLWSDAIVTITTTEDNGVSTTTTTRTTVSFAVAFGYPKGGGIAKLRRLFVNNIPVYDSNAAHSLKPGLKFKFYNGSRIQGQDPTIAAREGRADTPAFREMAYVVLKDFEVDWSGGAFPVVSGELEVNTSDVIVIDFYNTIRTTPPIYSTPIVDWSNGRAYYFGDDNRMDVFDLDRNTLIKSIDIGFNSFNTASAMSYGDGPYLYSQTGGIENHDPVGVYDKGTGALVSTYGTYGSSIGSEPGRIGFAKYFMTGRGVGGINEFLLIGTQIGELPILKRLGASLDWHTIFTGIAGTNGIWAICYAHVPGLNVKDKLLGDTSNTASGRPSPANVNRVSIFYVGTEDGHIYRIALTEDGAANSGSAYALSNQRPDGTFPILNRFEAVYHPLETTYMDGGSYYGVVNGKVTVIHEATYIPVPGSTASYRAKEYSVFIGQGIELLFDLPDGAVAVHIETGPVEDPFLSIMATHSGICELFIYDTPWSAVLPDVSAALALVNPDGTEYTVQTGLNLSYPLRSRTVLPPFHTASDTKAMERHRSTDNVTAYISGTGPQKLVILDMATATTNVFDHTLLSVKTRDDPTLYPGWEPQFRDVYDSLNDAMLYGDNNVPAIDAQRPGRYSLNAFDVSDYPLSTFIRQVCIRGGYISNDITITNVDQLIGGAQLNETAKVVDLLDQVCGLFRIDVVESQGKMHFIGRPSDTDTPAYAFNLTEADLILAQTDNIVLDNSKIALSDLPQVLTVDYLDVNNQCQIGTQVARRTKFPFPPKPIMNSVATLKLGVPIVFNATEALFWATRALFDMWAASVSLKFLVSQKQIALEPGDIGKLTMDNETVYTVKIEKVSFNGDKSIMVEASAISQYAENVLPDTINPPTITPTLVIPDKSDPVFDNNVPLVLPTAYVATAPLTVYWTAADQTNLMLSNGAVDYLTSAPSIGELRYGLASPDPGCMWQRDDKHAFTAYFDDATPVFAFTDTDEAFWSGLNACLIGSNGVGWELIYYRHYGLTTDNGYIFFGLMRGRNGSDPFTNHLPGERVVFLSPDAMRPIPIAQSSKDKVISVTSVPVGTTTNDSTTGHVLLDTSGKTLKPWSVQNIHATRDTMSHDITFTWDRRSRIPNELHDGDPDIPLGEASEAYRLDVLSDDGTAIIRAVTGVTGPLWVYSAANQVTDGFTVTDLRRFVRVFQISAIVGDGWPAERNVRIY